MTLDQVMKEWVKSRQPEIKPVMTRMRMGKGYTKYRIQLVEVWPDDMHIGASGLDEKVEWMFQTLKTWKTAKRTAWDMWVFDNKHEAEKFITLFTLQWA